MWKRSERTKKVDCQQVEAWLIAYLKGGLSPTRRQVVEQHLAACDACARSVQQAQILESELRLQAARHNPTLSSEASIRIHERVYRRMRRGLTMQRTVKLAGVAVVGLIIVSLTVGVMALWQGRPPETVNEQDVTPVSTARVLTLVPATDTPLAPTRAAEPTATNTPAPPTSVPEPTATDAETPSQAQSLYQTYSIGDDLSWGLAVADLNGDVLPDIAVTDNSSGMLRLLFNQGDGTFQEAPEIATGDSPYCVTAADLDADSHADLVVSHSPEGDQAGKLSVLLNRGDGSFKEQVDYATVDNWCSFAADVDGDTDLDLIIDDASEKGSTAEYGAAVWLNNGDGTFEAGARYFHSPYIGTLGAADMNSDGIPDLIIRHYPEPQVSIQLGNGDGSFGELVGYEAAPRLQAVVVADLDGDSNPDIATGNAQGTVNVLFNNGDGTLRDKVDYDVGGDIMNIVAIDMNGDDSIDLLFASARSGNLGLLTNNGSGTFELTREYYWKGAWVSNSFSVDDVDGDGSLDLVGTGTNSVYVIPLEDSD